MKRLSIAVCLSAMLFTFSLPSSGEIRLAEELPLPETGVHYGHADVPAPEEVLGHVIGERHTEPHQIVAYFEAVAEVSDRVTVHEQGRSYQGRPLIHAVVTSPANHEQIETIRQANQRIGDEPDAVDAEALADQPAVAYLGYTVHGDEASGVEAAMLTLYHLAAGQGGPLGAMLDNLVVIIEPVMNPDGHHRFTSWVNANRSAATVKDPANREHNQPWPGGRTNHYWFDPNRDYMALQHPEGQARQEVLNAWRPQLLCDFHEMGSESTYFFQPGVEDRVNPRTPPPNQALTERIARDYLSQGLGELGELFFTRETFDDFFSGKGSTYPDITGAIGILYEQASSRAVERERDHHGTLTYSYTVRNQFATSLSTLEAALEMREDLLGFQHGFFRDAPGLAKEHPVKAYVIPLDEHRARSQAMLKMMLRHRIEIHELETPVEAGGREYQPGEAVLIPLAQPRYRLIRAMMETQTEFEDDRFYDVSAWTKPLAFGVEAVAFEEDPAPHRGPRVEEVTYDGGELMGGRSDYAYIMRWDSYFAPRALYRFQDAGAHTRVIQRPFTTEAAGEPTDFERGAIMIPVRHSAHDFAPGVTVHDLIEEAVAEDHVRVYAVPAAMSIDGPDLGTRTFGSILEKPEAALVTGSGANQGAAGEVWHLLDQRFEMPVTLLDASRVSASNLRRYNRLVLAGSAGNVSASAVEDWVRDGGVLIATGGAARWAIGQEWVDLASKEFDMDELLEDKPWEDLSDTRSAQRIGGSIFEAALDTTHPIAYGYGETVPLFRTSNTFHKPAEKPGVNVGQYTDEPLLSGYISDEKLEDARCSAAIAADRLGGGRIILFMDNPNFRNFWYGANGLFLNALFFGDTF
ncbi:MAG: M14 family zinc carboxypeptidase [Candidatus Hydrogenedentota bacterium]